MHLETKGGPAEGERTWGLRVDPPRGIHLGTEGGPAEVERTWGLRVDLKVDLPKGSALGD